MSSKNTHWAVNQEKAVLRQKILRRRDTLSQRQVLAKSQRICRNLLQIAKIGSTANILLYSSIKKEVDTAKIIEDFIDKKANIFLPAYDFRKSDYVISRPESFSNLAPGPYQILQPRNPKPEDIDLVDVAIIPGVAFDKKGVRLGYGKGVYDKLLQGSKALKIGLAFRFQILKSLPLEKHDLVMDFVVSEEKIYGRTT